MTKFKSTIKNAIVKDFKEITSKRNNKYSVVTVENEGNEIELYNPSILEFEIDSVYDIDLEVTISKYSSAKIINRSKVEEKKGLFR